MTHIFLPLLRKYEGLSCEPLEGFYLCRGVGQYRAANNAGTRQNKGSVPLQQQYNNNAQGLWLSNSVQAVN